MLLFRSSCSSVAIHLNPSLQACRSYLHSTRALLLVSINDHTLVSYASTCLIFPVQCDALVILGSVGCIHTQTICVLVWNAVKCSLRSAREKGKPLPQRIIHPSLINQLQSFQIKKNSTNASND